MKLADLGIKAADLVYAARMATEAPYSNPAAIEYAKVLELLNNAFAGRRPA